jgi:hypothetical protein
MTFPPRPAANRTAALSTSLYAFLAVLACALWAPGIAMAQGTCSSDGQRPPQALLERFINADCAACWADAATPKTKAGALALDWIVPSPQGDEAPLSAAASRDALDRLETLRQNPPAATSNLTHQVAASPVKLRVAHGVALGGYMGASIELKAARGAVLPRQALTAWLLLVEAVPAGTDGTPVARNLVRNALKSTWNRERLLLISEQSAQRPTPPSRLYESRPMSIPVGSNPDRLQVVGWVEDAKGRVIAGAASLCDQP